MRKIMLIAVLAIAVILFASFSPAVGAAGSGEPLQVKAHVQGPGHHNSHLLVLNEPPEVLGVLPNVPYNP